MSIKLVISVTDYDWYQFLSQKPDLYEVNCWAPSGTHFRALKPGELFLFKLHAPHNVIVGGGVYSYSNVMPWSLAWGAFGEANGARSAEEMRLRIAKYRKAAPYERDEFKIGCRILTQPFFFDEANWLSPPPSWRPNIVSIKTYDTNDREGLSLWQAVQDRLVSQGGGIVSESTAQYGSPSLIPTRLGQGGFRVLVTDIYNRSCAVTGEKTLPALDAAHIRPYSIGGEHKASNGLLLRRDIHSLFDTGYVTITPSLSFEVSRTIKEEFENGRDYYALHGKQITVPERTDQHPDPKSLVWHNENLFRG